MTTSDTFNIKEAAKLSGLTPSVLRVWEFRYGWPSPKRSRNGYRCFTRPQVDDLVRAARLVKNGMAVSRLIIDGYPRWPAEQREGKPSREVRAAHRLAEPPTRAAAEIRDRVLTALDQANGGRLHELVSSACVMVRPREELYGVVLPAVIGLHELISQGRRLIDHDRQLAMLAGRARQLTRRNPEVPQARAVTLLPLSATDQATAQVAAAVLADQGRAVTLLASGQVPAASSAQTVVVGLGELPLNISTATRLTAIGDASSCGLATLTHLEPAAAIPAVDPNRIEETIEDEELVAVGSERQAS